MDAGNGLLYPLGGTRHLSIVVRLSPPPKDLPAKIARVTHLTRRMQFEPSPHECVGVSAWNGRLLPDEVPRGVEGGIVGRLTQDRRVASSAVSLAIRSAK